MHASQMKAELVHQAQLTELAGTLDNWLDKIVLPAMAAGKDVDAEGYTQVILPTSAYRPDTHEDLARQGNLYGRSINYLKAMGYNVKPMPIDPKVVKISL